MGVGIGCARAGPSGKGCEEIHPTNKIDRAIDKSALQEITCMRLTATANYLLN